MKEGIFMKLEPIIVSLLDTDLYNRQGRAINNFDRTLPPADSDLARQMAKDPYVFDYTGMTEQYNEAMLKRSLVDHVEKTLMEMGNLVMKVLMFMILFFCHQTKKKMTIIICQL